MSDSNPGYNPESEFSKEAIMFTGTAYLISQRDGITPEEAAVRLGELLGSADVLAQVQADQAAAAERDAAKEAAVQETVTTISSKLDELRALLSSVE